MLFITFIICPEVDDFLWWGGVLGGSVYDGKMDFGWPYGPGITDMTCGLKRGIVCKYCEVKIEWLPSNKTYKKYGHVFDIKHVNSIKTTLKDNQNNKKQLTNT